MHYLYDYIDYSVLSNLISPNLFLCVGFMLQATGDTTPMGGRPSPCIRIIYYVYKTKQYTHYPSNFLLLAYKL